MNTELEEKKYFVVRDVLSKDVLELVKYYMTIKFGVQYDFKNSVGKFAPASGVPDVVQPCSIYSYADAVTESLLIMLNPLMKEVTQKPDLECTYSFVRLYERGQWLEKHSDRPACQYSITLPLCASTDEPWTIFVDGQPVDLAVGDLVVYKGCEAKHWREPLEQEYQIQAHLHYVDGADPAYQPYIYDERDTIGRKKNA